MLEYPLDLPLTAKARIELALQAAEQAFAIVSGKPVDVMEDFSHHVIPIGPLAVRRVVRLGFDYPSDQAAVQFVIDVFETVVKVFSETAQTRSWSADDFRSWSERWCDDLAARAYQQNDVKTGVAHREPLEAFVARVRRAVVVAPCWSHYQEVLHTLSTAQATPPTVGQQLSDLKKKANWTVEELAEAVRLDRSNVLKHLSGKVKPRPNNLRQYEEAFKARLNRTVKLDG